MKGFHNIEPPAETVRVVISRHWNNPQITVTVNREKIELYMSIQGFTEALLSELGPAWKLFTRDRLRRKMQQAVHQAIEKTKEASNQVM